MSKVKISLDELKAAISEIEGRTQELTIDVEINDRQLKISASDRSENIVEAVLYDGGNLGAQFRCTERLMFMKDKKRI
jgi:hypothetical protein